MPKFLFEISYTLDGIKGVQSAGGTSRRKAAAQVAESVGGQLESFFMIAISVIPFLINVIATFINGEPAGDDPWEGNTLEWATTSPPPPYNFDTLPPIHSERPLFFLTHGHGHAAERPSDLEEKPEDDVERRKGLA